MSRLLSFVLLFAWLPQTTAAQTASDAVNTLQQGIVEILKTVDEGNSNDRFERFLELVNATHDMQTITRLTVHRAWRDLSPENQNDLVNTVTRLSAATYASRFKKYNGQQFSVKQETDSRGGAKLVNAELVLNDGKTIAFDYLLKNTDGTWLINNILVDGVSDLALKRAEYRDYLATGGYDNLLKELESQIARASDD
ncbi:MAG: ABC transporter substrate-binding protein [Pseudomonadota bacterium]